MASWTDILALLPQARALKATEMLRGVELTYPGLTGPFVYPVSHLQSRRGAGQPVDGASVSYILAQDLGEHNAAVQAGVEDQLESWFPNKDTQPRGGTVPTSSAVSDVQIMPDNSIVIRFGSKGKFYTYKHAADPRAASEEVARLFTAPGGIGRAIAKGTKKHLAPGDEGIPDLSVGSWTKGI